MSEGKVCYADRDIFALDEAGNYYCRHVNAMTAEGLHAKSDIAAELAWRDQRIDSLAAEAQRKLEIGASRPAPAAVGDEQGPICPRCEGSGDHCGDMDCEADCDKCGGSGRLKPAREGAQEAEGETPPELSRKSFQDLHQFAHYIDERVVACEQAIESLRHPAPREAKAAPSASGVESLLIEAEALLCDERGGPAANELAARIRSALSNQRGEKA